MAATLPPALRPGDKVMILSASRAVSQDEIAPASAWLREQGYRVAVGATVGARDHQFAGVDNLRAAEINRAAADPDIRALWFARGGYGAGRLLGQLDLAPLARDPKWLVGFSDVTAIHLAINKLNVASLHAPMPITFGSDADSRRSFAALGRCLAGHLDDLRWPAHPLNQPGEARGKLAGGNLSVIYSLCGTPYEIDSQGAILCLEDLDEYLYHIDRMANNLRLGGHFDRAAGLVAGHMSRMHDNEIPFGADAETILARQHGTAPRGGASGKTAPKAFGAPFGHMPLNLPLALGAEATLAVDGESATISYHGRA